MKSRLEEMKGEGLTMSETITDKLKPKQDDPRKIAKEGWSYYEQVGYNQAVSDCEAYYESKIKVLDEYDTMIILQVEYNKMTGESLEQDVALEMVKALNKEQNHE